MLQKPAATRVKIHDIIQNRWSPRAFAADKPVSQEQLLALMEAARWTASCFNDQPWRFIICDKYSNQSAWDNAFSLLADKNKLWAKNAPMLILSLAMQNFNHNGQPNRWALYDTGAACANLSFQAVALGLTAHQMGGFNAEQAKTVFNLPENCTPMAMMAVGYQAEVDVLAEDFKSAELAERIRAPLEERFFVGQWEQGILT